MREPRKQGEKYAQIGDCINMQRAVLEQRTKDVDVLIEVLLDSAIGRANRTETTKPPASVRTVLTLMLQALGASSNTIHKLTEGPSLHTRDCYCVVRSVVELAVNACYVLAEGDPAADRLIRHAQQKSLRDLDRTSEVADRVIRLKFSSAAALADQNTQAIIDEFTSRTGREKNWSDLSVGERIGVVGQKGGAQVGDALHFAHFMVYRHSSEILHGSFFGCLYFFGQTQPRTSPLRDPASILGDQQILILMASLLSLSATARAFHSAYGFTEVYKRDKQLWDVVWNHPLFADSKAAPDTDTDSVGCDAS